MSSSNKLASRVFMWAGCYGILALAPLYFLESELGRAFPPASTRPEQYYGFLGVALAWQFAFLIISSDVKRFRLMMLPAATEKLLAGLSVLALFWVDRVVPAMLAPALIDLLLGGLFLVAYYKTSDQRCRQGSSG